MRISGNNRFYQYAGIASLFILPLLFLTIILLPQHVHAMEPIWQVLKTTTSGEGLVTKNIWTTLMNLANTFVVVVLIAVAFAQILRLNVSTYGVKKILPTLVFAIIAANFSFLFCRLMVDFANAIMSIFFEGGVGITKLNEAFAVSIGNASNITGGDIFWFILGQLLKMVAAVFIYILAFLFLIRNWMIYFLVALAPFCLMAMVLPQTKSLFTQWWSNFAKWVFMPIVSVFWLWLGAQWFKQSIYSGVWLINYVFAGVCVYLAITNPFKMGGAIMSQWGGIGKKVWGATGKQALNGGKWLAGGGLASVMAYRNQQAANKLGLKQDQVDKYKAKAETWTKLNARARVAGYKGRFAAQKAAYEKAPMKTNYYNSLLGKGAAVQAGFDAGIEDDRNASAASNGAKTKKYLDQILTKDPSLINDFLAEAAHPDNAAEAKVLGFADETSGAVDVELYARHRMTDYIRSKNSNVLAQNFGHVLDAFKIGDMKSGATAFIQSFKGRGREEAFDAAYGSSAVGTPAAAAVTAAVAAVNAAAPNGGHEVAREAMFGAGNLDLKDLDENAYMNVKLVGVSDEGKTHLQSAFDAIRATREASVQGLIGERQKSVNDEVEGVKIILDSGSKHGYQRQKLRTDLDEARKLYDQGDLTKLETISPSIITDPSRITGPDGSKTEKLNAIGKRIEHLEAGLKHFDAIAESGSATQITAAIAHANQMIQSDPSKYVAEISQKLNQQNEIRARSQVAAGMVANNMASNPALQGVNLGSLHSSEHANSEVVQALDGLEKQIHSLSTGASLDPHSVSIDAAANRAATKEMATNILKDAQQRSFAAGAPAQGNLGDANMRRLFADQLGKAMAIPISKAMTGALNKTPLKVNVVNSKPAATSTAQPTQTPQVPPSPPSEPPKPE